MFPRRNPPPPPPGTTNNNVVGSDPNIPTNKSVLLQNKKPPKQHPRIYKPSIYSFTCRGVYYASTNKKSSLTDNEGICRGFRSRLELLQGLDENTRVGALKQFTSLVDDDVDELENDRKKNTAEHGLNQQEKSVVISPALIFHDDDAITSTNDKTTNIFRKQQETVLPEEELIQKQLWYCFGSTVVDYLVLKDVETGEQKIAAVAPRNNHLSIREIRSKADHGTFISSISLFGRTSFVHATGTNSFDDTATNNNDTNHQGNTMQRLFEATRNVGKQDGGDNTSPSGEEVQERLSIVLKDALQSTKRGVELTGVQAQKILHYVDNNLKWTVGTLQDDFLQRTIDSGKKICEQIPLTLQQIPIIATRTTKYIKKNFLDDNDSNDDNDRH